MFYQFHNLEKLLKPLNFTHYIQCPILEVKLSMLRLKNIDDYHGEIIFRIWQGEQKSIYDLINQWSHKIDFCHNYRIIQAEFMIRFQSDKIINIAIGYPSFFDKDDLSEEETKYIIKYFTKLQLIEQF
jgi:hypothetical protein